jgi:hypothetical protein
MAAVTLLGTPTLTTTNNATKAVTATPAAGDLIVLVVVNSGATAGTAPTDNNADGNGTYTLAETCLLSTATQYASVYIRDALVGSATSTVFTNNNTSNTGGGIAVLKVTGMSKTGATAKKQSAKQDSQSAGTPAPAMGAAVLTTNPVVMAAVVNDSSPGHDGTSGLVPRTSHGEVVDGGYSTPTTGLYVTTIDSGETGTTLTWGGAATASYGALAVELDASSSAITLDGTGSQLTLTGGTASLTTNTRLTATGGALALTGGTATFAFNTRLAATGGALALTGGEATLSYTDDVTLAGTGGALALTGGTATFDLAQDITLDGTGSALTLSGGSATTALTLVGDAGALALTGGEATLSYTDDVWLEGTGSALALTGGEATFVIDQDIVLIGTGGALTLAGGEATLTLTEAANEEEERSGGYGWENLAAIERRRRKREEEELADALECAMVAEGLIEPNPVVAARHVVRDYVKTSPPASRRMQRAVEYAYRAQTDLAWQLAAREIMRQEEEDFALLMVIAFAA